MQKTLFGTDGIRTQVGTAPLSPETLPSLARALGHWMHEKYGPHAMVLIGHDTRNSASWVKATIKSGLLLWPLALYDAAIIPTPALYYLTQSLNMSNTGILISASHNSYEDNGIKIIDRSQGKISVDDELKISKLFYYYRDQSPIQTITTLGTDYLLLDGSEYYCHRLQQLFSPNFLRGVTVVLDLAHGATYHLAPKLFSAFGAHVIAINNNPTGININNASGTQDPESLQKAVIAHRADIGFAFDGDGDRVIAVTRNGSIKDGDDILALLLDHPTFAHTPAIVATSMTNGGFEQYLKERNKLLIRARVGDKYVTEELEQRNLLLGGEQSGHIIMRDYLGTGDGIGTALRLLEVLLITNNWDLITFERYPQLLINLTVTTKKDLSSHPLATIIAHYQNQLQSGRLLVRYSGTEQLLRIMIEDSTLKHAQDIGTSLVQELKRALLL